ncbi:VOC family protein [Streptomyces alboflavus]|uniref:Glyoxalase n=1 Tax=Streptomyces alboflavus TaxID=67267 RepID=A0A1Z1WPB1_9ACTN|nr:VOC family protein [Streptomyces alboflavus]ARX88268.1 glyoxalase [Streptomyces alboflavus]
MARVTGFGNVVLPARDLPASIAAWTALLGRQPAFQSDDFAAFSGDGVEIGLTAAPWVDHPLVFWTVQDIEQSHRTLVAAGATAMTEVADGTLAEVGTAEAAEGDNIDPATGIVDMPGARLAVLKAADGNLIAITQEVPVDWPADQS